jgi:serine/threonine protein kinase
VAILHEHIEGKYEILGKLREGGMGAVYKVRHRLLDEIRVVKVLHPRLTVTPELSERFLREARLAIQLRHPNIAQLHDFSVAEDGSAFIVMEFIDGVTLEGILARTGPPPLGLGLEIGRQSLRALGLLHRRGLLHRDISPDNLMLTREPEGGPLVKLIDLGIAKVLKGDGGGLTSTGLFLGKPRYASPEQFGLEGTQGVDARSDLYSFGVVLYELLTGVCPIRGRDPSSFMASHLFRAPIDFAESDPQGRLPADLREILLRALARNPEDRFANAEELSRALVGVQTRFPFTPADLDAVLLAAVEPAAELPKPGSTQDKLNRQFAGPTPAPTMKTVMITPIPEPAEPTLILPGAAADALDETLVAPGAREPAPPPVPEPAPPPAALPPSVPETKARAPQPREDRGRTERRSRIPLAAALLLFLVLILAGFGFWWRSRPDSAPSQTAAATPPPVGAVPPPPQPVPVKAADIGLVPAAPSPPPPAVQAKASPLPVETPREREAPVPTPTPAPHREKVPEPRKATVPPPERPAPQPKPEPPAPRAEKTPASPALTLGSKDVTGDDPDVDPPQFLSAPTPVFPEAARGTHSYARIVVSVRVDEKGAVSEARIKEAYVEDGTPISPNQPPNPSPLISAFREAALEAARKARFEPASRNGAPVKAWGELKFEFGKKAGN